jgi:hypothetical protein
VFHIGLTREFLHGSLKMMSAAAGAADDGIRFLEGGKSAGMSQRIVHETEGGLDLHTLLVATTLSPPLKPYQIPRRIRRC